jgi:hypothetical protein
MKNLQTYFNFFKRKAFLIILALELFSLAMTAQDAVVLEVNSPMEMVYVNEEVDLSVTLGNIGEVPLFDGVVLMQIFYGTDIVHEYFLPISILQPNSEMIINSSPDTWVPFMPGSYLFRAEAQFPGDLDLSNNMLEFEFSVIEQPIDYFIEQVNMHNPYQIDNSMFGIFQMNYLAQEFISYANVMAWNPLDGNVEWIVRNFPLTPHENPQVIDYWFDFGMLGYVEGMDISEIGVSVSVTSQIVLEPWFVEIWYLHPVLEYDYDVLSINPTEAIEVYPPADINYISYNPIIYANWEFRDCDVPNIDLDDTNHPVSPDYAGDLNACGPAAAANSIKWLENTHPDIPNSGTTHRGAMESMSGHMDRGNGEGVTTTQLVKGKLGYIDEHGLRFHVLFHSWWLQNDSIGSPNPIWGHEAENKGPASGQKPPTWEFFKSEMDKGEDVEILFGWYDVNGNRSGGHWVTASGYYEDNNTSGIFIKDDGNQTKAGGTRQTYHDWVPQGDWSRLGGYDGPNGYCWIESVVSESYDAAVTFDIFDLLLERVIFIEDTYEPYDRMASLTFNFPPEDYPRFLNIRASLPESVQEEWVLRNIMLPPFYDVNQLSTWFDLDWIGVEDIATLEKVHMEVSVTEDIIYDSFFDVIFEIDLPVVESEFDVGDGVFGEDVIEDVVVDPDFPVFDPDSITTYIYRGCTIPNIDLDHGSHPAGDGYAGDRNACAPASAANSMDWLEATYSDLIPSTNTTLREKLKELSGFMNRPNNGGVNMNNTAFVEGKLAYIDEHQLPIHVKFQGFVFDTTDIDSPNSDWEHSAENKNTTPNQKPSWAFLKAEIERGEDVEITYGKYVNGVRRGGHAVVVSGINESGGVRRICFKHDRRQSATDSTFLRQEVVTWKPSSTGSGHIYFPEMSNSTTGRFVEGIISESPDTMITFPNAVEGVNAKPFEIAVINNPGSLYDPVKVTFNLPKDRVVHAKIFDMRGTEMFEKRLGYLNRGKHNVDLYAEGIHFAGNYVLVLFAEDISATVIFVKM